MDYLEHYYIEYVALYDTHIIKDVISISKNSLSEKEFTEIADFLVALGENILNHGKQVLMLSYTKPTGESVLETISNIVAFRTNIVSESEKKEAEADIS